MVCSDLLNSVLRELRQFCSASEEEYRSLNSISLKMNSQRASGSHLVCKSAKSKGKANESARFLPVIGEQRAIDGSNNEPNWRKHLRRASFTAFYDR